jgi:low temperature requirement protein LtrA
MIVVALWWIYFDSAAEEAEESLRGHANPVLAAADAYSYIHLLLVAGIVYFAFGARWAVAGIGAPLDEVAQAGLFGGVALYLVGHAAFRRRLTRTRVNLELAAAVFLGAEYVLARASMLDAWTCLTGIAAVLAWLTVAETRRAQRA